ncbi:MAG: hypothetical protein JWN79_2584 [Gemmatimonadetes bacterium]|jgi:hypothetical protein|nr:hypothetical protein [Gemmatimonadota bacterium]
MRSLALLVALFLLGAPPLCAQYATPYGPVEGSRVRVTPMDSGASVFTGSLRAFGGDSLVVDVGSGAARLRMPLARLRRMEVSEGKNRAGTALVWSGIGLLAGGVLGATALSRDPLERFVGGIAGMGLGLVTGAVAGALAAPERWRVVWAPR